jgi:hypothetical protein
LFGNPRDTRTRAKVYEDLLLNQGFVIYAEAGPHRPGNLAQLYTRVQARTENEVRTVLLGTCLIRFFSASN